MQPIHWRLEDDLREPARRPNVLGDFPLTWKSPFHGPVPPSIAVTRVMMNRSAAASALLIVAALSFALSMWSTLASGHFCWQLAVVAPLLWIGVGWVGASASSWLVDPSVKINPLEATLVGVFLLSTILFVGTALLHIDIILSLAFGVALLSAFIYATRKGQPLHRFDFDPVTIFALLVAIIFTTLWSRQNLTGVVVTPTSVTSVPWLDTFYHAIQISHFGHGSGRYLATDPLVASAPLPPYHYAAYMIPSLLVRVVHLSSYVGAVALFAPLGTLLTGLAAYGFGRAVAGSLGGLLAVVVCLAIPDPTFYLLENRWISYFFFQQISGTGAFGTALMLVAWTLCIQGVTQCRRRLTLVGLLAGACVAIFKSQIFAAYSIGLLLFALATFPRLAVKWRSLVVMLATGVVILCVYKILPAIPRAPTLLPGTTAGPTNLHWTLSKIGGPCQQCANELSHDYPSFLLVAVPAFATLTFGIILPLCIGLVNTRSVRRALRPGSLWLLSTTWVNYFAITVGLELNSGHGDPYEIIHKTFVWPYLAISTWCGSALGAWLQRRTARVRFTIVAFALPITLLWLGPKVMACADQLQTAFVYPGSDTGSRLTLPRQAYNAAEFLRTMTPLSSTYQTSKLDGDLMFQSLAERHVYVNPPRVADVAAVTGPARSKVEAMLAAPTEQELMRLARETHIDYFVLYPGQTPAWGATIRPVFQSGEYRVYEL